MSDGGGEAAGAAVRLTSRRLRDLGRPARPAMVATAGLALAVTGTRVAQALLVASVLGHVLHHHGSVGPEIGIVAALGATRLALIAARDRRAAATAAALRADLRARLYRHLMDLGPAYLARHRTGAVESVLIDAVDRLGDYYGGFVPLAAASTVAVVTILAWVAALDPVTAAAMAVAAALVPLAPVLTARAFGETGRRFADGLGRIAAEYLDAVQGLVTLKAFDAQGRWGERLAAESEELSADATALSVLANIHIGFVALGMAAGTVLGVALATARTTHHAVSGAALLAILLLARECFLPLAQLQAAFPGAYEAVARANGVFDLLDAVPGGRACSTATDVRGLRPTVSFEGVCFSYRPERAPALEDVTFSVEAGETAAIVGPSGAGKTTVVSLLQRFFEPSAGVIRIGGEDIAGLDPVSVRSLMAVTFQDPYLFHRSVADNLRLGRPSATDAEVEAAARAANAHEFVVSLPQGYDTVVHERGARLSGGQRQRLAIARALVADTPILVLDEPTSSVDAESETLITDGLRHLARGRTTLVIAHRLSTIARADRVIVLEAGRVAECGSPEELRSRDGLFARLVEGS